jgi:wyosine [tRNA(Phe)-imidazoG37] synthetase (radical SAM superfamily)
MTVARKFDSPVSSMPQQTLPQSRFHPRQYEQNRFVYPVLSRRSGGISIGVNLNPDKVCNFDCIYCQVDRRSEAETKFVEMDRLLEEVDQMLGYVISRALFNEDRFASVPAELRRLNDVAFSGDGEPTTYRNFDEIIARVAEIKRRHEGGQGLRAEGQGMSPPSALGPQPSAPIKLVLITNASMFHREAVKRGLEILDASNGEIWAKLEAGTEEYFQLIDRTKIPFRRILDNITQAARIRPLVIQSLFMNVHGDPPPDREIEAFLDRLEEIQSAGGQLKLVQVYTVARQPAESFVTPLPNETVDEIARRVTARTGIPTESYYG